MPKIDLYNEPSIKEWREAVESKDIDRILKAGSGVTTMYVFALAQLESIAERTDSALKAFLDEG